MPCVNPDPAAHWSLTGFAGKPWAAPARPSMENREDFGAA
jgi:hypothetical protein